MRQFFNACVKGEEVRMRWTTSRGWLHWRPTNSWLHVAGP